MNVCVSVCLSVCRSVHLSASVSPEQHVRASTNVLCTLPMAVARSSSGSVEICYVLPVLWTTSCFTHNGQELGDAIVTR